MTKKKEKKRKRTKNERMIFEYLNKLCSDAHRLEPPKIASRIDHYLTLAECWILRDIRKRSFNLGKGPGDDDLSKIRS